MVVVIGYPSMTLSVNFITLPRIVFNHELFSYVGYAWWEIHMCPKKQSKLVQ